MKTYMLRIVIDNECIYNIRLYDDMIIREEVEKIEDLEGRPCLYYDVY